ncbi:MAG: hypothetical protein D6683_11720, partial [Actinomyces sp.]
TAAWDRRLAALPPRRREAVVLRHVAGLGCAEIAHITGRPVGTVKADVHRGLAQLRRLIDEENRTHGGRPADRGSREDAGTRHERPAKEAT